MESHSSSNHLQGQSNVDVAHSSVTENTEKSVASTSNDYSSNRVFDVSETSR